ncbi:hypothetical protein [Hydrogenophaga sp.]|uniref:hypothetical protein n=1 Tax=Hydrogenophaga sp. TaxID=1904254 RepID=UPI002725ECE4|nr:hypothetical protein [Hydrogenophaga sp.]MDO9434066.1 hypothetical protein [Hydrogenophaga sp.]
MADSRLPPIGANTPPVPSHSAAESAFPAGTEAGAGATGLSNAQSSAANGDIGFDALLGWARDSNSSNAAVPRPVDTARRYPVVATNTSTNTTASTITSTTDTSAQTTTTTTTSSVALITPALQVWWHEQDALELMDPDVLQKRANLRNRLFSAIASYDVPVIAILRAQIREGARLANYLPEPNPEAIPPYVLLRVEMYQKEYGPDEELKNYAIWCTELSGVAEYNLPAVKAIAASSKVIKQKVQDICTALKRLDDAADDAILKERAAGIKKILKDNQRTTALALAEHPGASTRMMLQKCTLLEKFIDGTTLRKFRAKVEQAHQERKKATAELSGELLKSNFDAGAVTSLSVLVYARRMTTANVDFLRPGFTESQLQTMFDRLEKVIDSPRKTTTVLEIVALRSINNWVEIKLNHEIARTSAMRPTPSSS